MGMGPVWMTQDYADDQQRQDYMQQFSNAAHTPIPGVTGPTTPMAGMQQPVGTVPIAGMPPSSIPGLPLPMTNPTQMISPGGGPYAQQAMLMAGLLGRPTAGYSGGLLGKRPFRPGGK